MSQTELMQRSILFLNWLYSTRNRKSHRGIKPWGYPHLKSRILKTRHKPTIGKLKAKGKSLFA